MTAQELLQELLAGAFDLGVGCQQVPGLQPRDRSLHLSGPPHRSARGEWCLEEMKGIR